MQLSCTAKLLAALALGVNLAGCQSAAVSSHRALRDSVGSANLVMPESSLMDLAENPEIQDPRVDQEPWTYARNDVRLGSPPGTGVASIELLEVRQRDFLRTINGRPREFSTTYVTTIKRGATR